MIYKSEKIVTEDAWYTQTRYFRDKDRSQEEEEDDDEDNDVVDNNPVHASANLDCEFYESATQSPVPTSTSNSQSRNPDRAVNNMSSLSQTVGYPNPPNTALEGENPYPELMGPNIPFRGPSRQNTQLFQYQQQHQNSKAGKIQAEATPTPSEEVMAFSSQIYCS